MHFQSVQMKQTPPVQGIFLLIFTVHGMKWIRRQGKKIDQATRTEDRSGNGQKIDQATGQELDQAGGAEDRSGSSDKR
jgi:hypothetical protein